MKEKYYPPLHLNGIEADDKLEELKEEILKKVGAKVKNRLEPFSGIEHITYEFGNSKLEIERAQKVKGRWTSLYAEISAYITGPSKELRVSFENVFCINKGVYKEKNWAEKIFSH